VGDGYVSFQADGANTKVMFDTDGPGTANPWPTTVTTLMGVSSSGLTWAQLSGGGTTPPPSGTAQIGFTTSSVTLAEGNTGLSAFSFVVARTGGTTGASTATWSVSGSGANPAAGADFSGAALPTGTLSFAAGETSKTITVNVAGDTVVEPTEGFTVTLTGATGATLGTATASGVITNDDSTAPPSGQGQVITSKGPGDTLVGGAGADTLNASQGSDVLTGAGGADRFVFGKEPWSPARITDFTVGTDILDLSALFQSSGYAGSDPVADKYVIFLDDGAAGTKLLFDRDSTATGQQWGNYIITLEGVPTAGLTWAKLSGGGATTPPPSGSTQVGFSTPSVTLAEGNSGMTAFAYTVARSGPTTAASSVTWTVSGSGANPASAADFSGAALPTGTLTFAAGETSKTFTVNVAGDTAVESTEGFTVTLSGATGATLGTATASGVITNDDTASPPGGGQVINSPGYGSTLTGGAGADTLNAGQGPDTLTGGGGADLFVYKNPPWNPGKVTDFVVGSDKLDLSGLFQAAGYTGSNPVGDGYVSFQADGANTKVMFDTDGPGTANPWPTTVTTLMGVSSTGLTWNQLSGGGTSAPPAAAGTFVVFAGQSNTGGYGMSTSTLTSAWKPDPLTLIWNNQAKQWVEMNPGVNTGYPGHMSTWGPEVQFALDFRAAHPDEVLRIVKDAEGGTPLNQDTATWHYDWSPASTDELFDRTTVNIQQAGAAAGGERPDAVFFGQGEEDANSAAAARAYGPNLTAFVDAVRTEWMGDPDGKIGIFQIGDNPTYAADVRTAQQQVDAADPDLASFDTANLPLQADGLHYAAAGFEAIGASYFDFYAAWRAGGSAEPPPPPGQVIVSDSYGDVLTGGAGADTLIAGQGPDVLTGGGGPDHFVYNDAPWNPGRITDFVVASDKVDLRGILDDAGYTGANGIADRYVLLENVSGGVKVSVDMDGPSASAGWPVTVTTLSGVTVSQLSAGNWIFQ
jgi:Ca2+-binding RTX toxin-like protein